MKKDVSFLTKEYVEKYFTYKDGILYWIKNGNHRVEHGSIAGCVSTGRYWQIVINRVMRKRSQLVFLMHHGYIPKIVDHIDRDKLNDRIENLRACTFAENARNRNPSECKSSKYMGVTRYKNIKTKYESFQSSIFIDNKTIIIGRYKDENQAALEYNKMAVRHFGEFAYINIVSSIKNKWEYDEPYERNTHVGFPVLNLETGIYYSSISKALIAHNINNINYVRRLKKRKLIHPPLIII